MNEHADVPYIEQWYRRFATSKLAGQSDLYRSWALGVADDTELLRLLCELPREKRQPHLVFAVSRLLGAPEGEYRQWQQWMLAHWPRVRAEALVRTTQTNEPGRCAAILPLLAQIDGPIALLEVGTSAGLCLYPDRYSYDYVVDRAAGPVTLRLDPADGPSEVVLRCEVTGNAPLPTAMPDIVWRAGIDLAPLDVTDPADVRWLQMLVGPEQQDRRDRIAAAAQIVRQDPPHLVAGDVTAALAAVATSAPADATLVVLVVGVLVYLGPQQRSAFTEALAELADYGARWISLEDAPVFPAMAEAFDENPAPRPGLFPLTLDGDPVAWCSPHGQSIAWIAEP
ncbi:hypothetical protein B0I08_10765 [Glaciihabitans tibetensis]|uniref:DUF2332 domain-containing protein n=1 Tax=Glaciihabitans tibetensis TaxID=1266600 RepID=A0A2T0VAI9_9MICO|nr:DUF2332 domain-containing protein [Glaciihabitans tibetensis]PRY67171.1 hypothetical protein B0I08_10765 [Glaciihabitans tibetensis]